MYKHGQAAINHQKGVTACANELIKISWQSSYQRDNDDNNGGSGARRHLHRLAKRLRHSLLECATRTYGRQIYTSYLGLTFWEGKKEILKIESIYLLVVTKDEGIAVIDAELEPEIQRWDCYCGYRWTRCY